MDLNRNRQLHLKDVNQKNRKEAESLSVFSEQTGFIESISECLQEADKLELWRPTGIYDGDILVGFAMYGYFPKPAPGQLWLDRILIDKKYQGRGYGKQAVLTLLDRLYSEYGKNTETVYLSVYEDNRHAIQLYQEMGFRFNGKHDTKGELIMEYHFQSTDSKSAT